MLETTRLRTFLEVAMASIQTTMIELEKLEDEEWVVDAYCELEMAYVRTSSARKRLK